MRWASRVVWGICSPEFFCGAILFLCGGGCAAKLQGPRGDTLVMGFVRGTTSLRTEDGMVLARDTGRGAPIEIGLVPYGFEIGLGLATHAEEVVIAPELEGEFRPRKSLSVPLGSGEGAWRFGFEKYRVPREGTRIRARVNTVTGLAVRVAHREPWLRAGVSRTTITEVQDENQSARVEYRVNGGIGEAKILEEQSKE